MDSCIVYDEMFYGQYKPYQNREDLKSFNQLNSVLNVCTKFPELSESFLIQSMTTLFVHSTEQNLEKNGETPDFVSIQTIGVNQIVA